MIGAVAQAAGECAKNYSSNEEVYIRVHAYVKYHNTDWIRLGSDMKKVKVEEVYETAGKLTQKMLSEGLLSNVTFCNGKAIKVVLDNRKGNICERDIGANFLPL